MNIYFFKITISHKHSIQSAGMMKNILPQKISVAHNDEVSNAHFNYLAVYFLCSFPAFKETVKTRIERIVCSACAHKTLILWSGQMSVQFRCSPACYVRGSVHDQRHTQGINVSVSCVVCTMHQRGSEGERGSFTSSISLIHILDCHCRWKNAVKFGHYWFWLVIKILFINLVMAPVIPDFSKEF